MQFIEGYRTVRLGWGAIGAKPVTVAFWSSHNPAGVYSLTLRNITGTRTYAATYTQAVGGTQQYNAITIPGCTDGVWDTTNSTGIIITLAQAAGTTQIAPSANSWVTGNYLAAPGQINGVATASNLMRVGGFLLLPGSSAPSAAQSSLIVRRYDQELATCQRYFYSWKGGGTGFANGATIVQLSQLHPVAMRANPTMVGVAGVLATIDTSTASNINPSSNSVTLLGVNTQALEFRLNNYVGLSAGQVCAVQPQTATIANVDARL